MPQDGRSVWQPSTGSKKVPSPYVASNLARRDPAPPMVNSGGNQQSRRFAGSVILGKLPTPPKSNVLDSGTNGKFGIVDELLDEDESWTTQAVDPKNTAQAGMANKGDLITAMAGLTVQPGLTTETALPEWRRGTEKHVPFKPSPSRGGNKFCADEKQHSVFKGAASVMSCTYQRTLDQPRMNDANPTDYRPFLKHEFVLGTILRGIIHEQDIMGTPDPAMSQAPTNFTSAKSRNQVSTAPTNAGNRHIGHGEWGPIYSENRFLIVVHNRPGDHYYAVPVYSHKRNGLAKKLYKNEYVSVADGRYPYNVEQQSEHRPITALLKKGVDELLPMSAAYASYAVPRKYGLPVAHQGRLDEESTRRLVSMYHEWTGRKESNEL